VGIECFTSLKWALFQQTMT